MKTFEITFGTENKSMTITDKSTNIITLLEALKVAGWEVEEITNIKNV